MAGTAEFSEKDSFLLLSFLTVCIVFLLLVKAEVVCFGICVPIWVVGLLMHMGATTPRREREDAERKRKRRKVRAMQTQFEMWAWEHHQVGLVDSDYPRRGVASSHLLWPSFIEAKEAEKRALAAKKRKYEEALREKKWREQQEREEARKKRAAARKKKAAERKKAQERAAIEKAREAERTKKHIRDSRIALDSLDRAGAKRKLNLVSKSSKKALLDATSKYTGIRRSGTVEQIMDSALSRIDAWSDQIDRIEHLNDGISRDTPFEEFHAIGLALEDLEWGDLDLAHPLVLRKGRNLKKRVASRKEKLERGRKEGAFSRAMIQTRDVPNATLNRKEKSWKAAAGACVRCGTPSSDMGFYWDVYPELMLVVICDGCASKEEFVHADGPVEIENADLGDDFLGSLR
jgi:hypothetical protein